MDQDTRTQAAAVMIATGLERIPFPMMLLDLDDCVVRGANAAMHDLTRDVTDQIVGRRLFDFYNPEERDNARRAIEAIRDGRLEGYQARRTLIRPRGVRIPCTMSVRRLTLNGSGGAWALVMTITDDGSPAGHTTSPALVAGASPMLMLVTDHEWTVQHASSDAIRVLHTKAEDLLGKPVLGLIHPGSAEAFFMATAQAVSNQRAMTARARMRRPEASADWADTICSVTALCQHSPPRLGLAICQADRPAPAASREQELEQILWRITSEVRAAGVLGAEAPVMVNGDPHDSAQLSSRQWEIVNRLVAGQTVPRIAEAMFLSPSTVRNHLAAAYRKFGIHSQVELIAMLRSRGEPLRVG